MNDAMANVYRHDESADGRHLKWRYRALLDLFAVRDELERARCCGWRSGLVDTDDLAKSIDAMKYKVNAKIGSLLTREDVVTDTSRNLTAQP